MCRRWRLSPSRGKQDTKHLIPLMIEGVVHHAALACSKLLFGPRWEQQLPGKHFNNQSYLTYCWGGIKRNLEHISNYPSSTNLSPGHTVCSILDFILF